MHPRQEVLNVLLAQLLQESGVIAAPEQVLKAPLQSVKLPDVLVDFNGLRLMIEAEFSGPGAEKAAYDKATERVEMAIAHIGVAVIYPRALKKVGFERLKSELNRARLKFLVITEAILIPGAQLEFFSEEGAPRFSDGEMGDLVEALSRCYEQLVRDDTLEKAVALLQADIDWFATAVSTKRGPLGRLADALNVGQSQTVGGSDRELRQQGNALVRVTALIFANAMIFQQVLSESDSRVHSLRSLMREENLFVELSNAWHFILDEINYYPIFHMADTLLNCFGADLDLERALRKLLETSGQIVQWRASLRHDLAGRIYHRLLKEAKYLGAYYTSIPAAALLLKLALSPDHFDIDWSSNDDLKKLRIADLACGTGTLLMATADVILDNYVRACARKGKKPELDILQRVIVEKVIHGYDVLPSAVHLTASTLALRVPEMPIDVTHLYALPLGGPLAALGSLEFLRKESVNGTLFGRPEQVTGKGPAVSKGIAIPELDLCVMNPPFTRSVGGNLLFGNLPEHERSELQEKLKKTVKEENVQASVTAGLGAVFVALGDRHLKPNGRIALVLPRALVSGVSWKQTRDLISESYQLEYLVVSHEPSHWNFSENTELSEVLMIARKLANGERIEGSKVICLNLWHRPRTAIEALNIVSSLRRGQTPTPDLCKGTGVKDLEVGGYKFGEAISIDWQELREDAWGLPCSFAQAELTRALYHLTRGDLYLPHEGICGEVPLCPLGELGELGFDCRDMHDGFRISKGKTVYPAFWSHDTAKVTSIEQEPNAWLSPLSSAKDGRPLRDARHLWKKAGRLLIVERAWLNTLRVNSVRVEREVLSNVWWSFSMKEGPRISAQEAEKALALWLNSTLGVLMSVGKREETRGAWVKFKKPVLHSMPVLNVNKIGKRALRKLVDGYDALASQNLQPLPEADKDPVRAAIDEVIAGAMKLPDFAILRELLAREPIISLDLAKLTGLPRRGRSSK